jgi:hypothetical protein
LHRGRENLLIRGKYSITVAVVLVVVVVAVAVVVVVVSARLKVFENKVLIRIFGS